MTSNVPATPPVETVLNMALGYLMSRSLHVATELGIADHLADGPRPLAELATRIGAHRLSLRRLLRALAALGGGRGGLLAQLLQRCPSLQGTLFDQAQVVADATALSEPELAGRWTALAGDFFAAVPKGADAYVLKRILHDWSDEDCVRILSRCCEAMHGRSRLFVAEAVLPPGNAAHPGKVMDMLMMIFASGRERSAAEFEALLREAGLQLVGIQATASTLSVIEARPA